MRKFTIFVDMDDTIENLGDAWREWLNEKYGLNVRADEITYWRAFVDVYTKLGLTVEQVYEPLKYEPEFWKTVKPKEDAIEYLKKLIDDGHKVFLLTSSFGPAMYDKFVYALFPYFPYFDYHNIIITHDKTLFTGDVLIDDYENNLIFSRCTHKILYNAMHNKNFKEDEYNITRGYGWKHIYEYINQIC